jgi:hypothetical protein
MNYASVMIDYTCRYLATKASRRQDLGGSATRKSGVTMVVYKLRVARRYLSALIHQHAVMNNLSTSHRSRYLFRHSRIASAIRGTATALEKAALVEAELSGVGIGPNDRHTARIYRSFKGCPLSQCLRGEDIEFPPSFSGLENLSYESTFAG